MNSQSFHFNWKGTRQDAPGTVPAAAEAAPVAVPATQPPTAAAPQRTQPQNPAPMQPAPAVAAEAVAAPSVAAEPARHAAPEPAWAEPPSWAEPPANTVPHAALGEHAARKAAAEDHASHHPASAGDAVADGGVPDFVLPTPAETFTAAQSDDAVLHQVAPHQTAPHRPDLAAMPDRAKPEIDRSKPAFARLDANKATLSRLERQLNKIAVALPSAAPRPSRGRLLRAVGTVLRAMLPDARMGELCRLEDPAGGASLMAEVVGLDGSEAILAPIGDTRGLSTMAEVVRTGDVLRVPAGPAVLGRVLDGLGRPLDEATAGPLDTSSMRAVEASPPDALERQLVEHPMPMGVRAIDGLLTVGEGQRIGIYGEPGGGKSTLLAQLVRGAQVDVVVVGLIGERGREVRDFIETQIDAETRARTVLVVATSDRPAVERLKATYTATAIAESFRDEGLKVLLVIDSLTRFARALREIGLAAGEPPTRRGFPPSVMAELPRLMERAGPAARGSITAFYTVLYEGDGNNDPIAEETRGIADGHIILSPKLAGSGHYPAIDILVSRSRVMDAVTTREHRAMARSVRDLMQRYQDIEFLVQVGEYKSGVDPRNDMALAKIDEIKGFLQQATDERTEFEEMLGWLQSASA